MGGFFRRKKAKQKTQADLPPDVRRNDGGVIEDDDFSTPGSFFIEVIKVVIIASLILIPTRQFLIKPFYVRGASMEPNFHDFEYLVIDELSFRFREPKRGEVIVFHNPSNKAEFFIKRIIGLPGDKVQIKNNEITIYDAEHPEGFTIDEFYLGPSIVTTGRYVTTVGADEYYVMGDNRPASHDSRAFGPIVASSVVGRIWFRAWPPSRITHFKPFTYPFVSP